ncbi:MAG: peptidylprolyl isomerase [Methanosarcinaceae archaeon]|nr:peptidylprolyl isomerase [Methanosarcinaceae archaeon]
MAVEKGDFIKINYTGRFEDGGVFDTTDEQLAKDEGVFAENGLYGGDIIIVGAGHTIPGLDEDFVGKDVGKEIEITLDESKAFGPIDPRLVSGVSVSKFKDGRAEPGMVIEQDGRRGVVTRVIGRRATIDFNNPLAGKTVVYNYTIDEVLSDDVDKVKGLYSFYTGIIDSDVTVEDGIAKIVIPLGLTFNQRWLLSKGKMANDILENTDIKEVLFIEKYDKKINTEENNEEKDIEEDEN